MRYTINLVRDKRIEDKKRGRQGLKVTALTSFSFGLLAISLFYATLQVVGMRGTISHERKKLAKIEAEYKRYKSTKMIVDKSDIELLDRLQNDRIFWTKKLAVMASYLPKNFWITEFEYNGISFKARGYGYISAKQKQLIIMDNYLNKLRADKRFNDVFKKTSFDATVRQDEEGRRRVSFDYSSMEK